MARKARKPKRPRNPYVALLRRKALKVEPSSKHYRRRAKHRKTLDRDTKEP